MTVPLLAPKTPCEIEATNFKRHYTEPSIGKVYRLSFEVSKETWDACELIPKTATIKGVIWWEAEFVEPKPEPQVAVDTTPPSGVNPDRIVTREPKKKEPALFSYYWQQMFAKGFNHDLDLQEALDTDAAHVHAALREVFEVEHLSESVAPATFEKWVKDQGLKESLITMSRNAQVAALKRTE